MIDPSDAVQIPLAEFDSSESETEASSIDSGHENLVFIIPV